MTEGARRWASGDEERGADEEDALLPSNADPEGHGAAPSGRGLFRNGCFWFRRTEGHINPVEVAELGNGTITPKV